MGSAIATGGNFDRNWQAIPIGFGAGAVFGAILGYITAPDLPQSSAQAPEQSSIAPTASQPEVSAAKNTASNAFPESIVVSGIRL
jgi:hypothetical protein